MRMQEKPIRHANDRQKGTTWFFKKKKLYVYKITAYMNKNNNKTNTSITSTKQKFH